MPKLENPMELIKRDLLDYKDPGAMDDELFRVPGMVTELTNLTLANAPRPNRPLAFMGALAMVAHLAGRTYEDEHGTHANLYLVSLAPTGMGKDEPRLTNQKLAAAVGALESVPDSLASFEGLEDALVRSPALLVQNDEADALFGAMSSSGVRAAKLNASLLSLYSKSRGPFTVRLKAGGKPSTIVDRPHLTLFATGVPEYVYRALSPKALTDGLMGRCLFFETAAFCRLGDMANAPLPPTVIAAAREMVARERAFAETGVYDPIVVTTTPEARELVAQMRSRCDDLAEEALNRGLCVASALLCRFSEKATKLAMVGAISENQSEPQISAEAVIWAANVVAYVTKQMLARSAIYVAEGKFGKLKSRALAMLEKHGGSLDRSTFLKNLSVDLPTFRRLIETLVASDLIEAETINNGKTVYRSITED